ncbi:MAG: hypothetical protein KGI59_03250, partial [Patescibacteria group bacterium]|nr:hypothetical protein [Patescibacteria group bacterium]
QAQAAVAEVSPLVPDQGDKTVMASNTSTMKDARAKIKTAVSDLTAARKDALTIIQGLVKYDKSAMATDNGSTAGSATPVSTATSTGTTTQ